MKQSRSFLHPPVPSSPPLCICNSFSILTSDLRLDSLQNSPWQRSIRQSTFRSTCERRIGPRSVSTATRSGSRCTRSRRATMRMESRLTVRVPLALLFLRAFGGVCGADFCASVWLACSFRYEAGPDVVAVVGLGPDRECNNFASWDYPSDLAPSASFSCCRRSLHLVDSCRGSPFVLLRGAFLVHVHQNLPVDQV